MVSARSFLYTLAMNRLTLGTKIGYGVGDLGGNLFFTVMGFYLLFYLTDVVGLVAGLAGTALMIGKIWDAVTDPVVGVASDRTITRWGRRRPYMTVGALLLIVSMWMLFGTPVNAAQNRIFLYVVIAYCLVNTGYTLINIPYGALTPELTDDYHERTVLNGYRMTFAVIGTFIGVGAVLPLVSTFGGGAPGWTGMGVVIGVIVALATMTVVLSVREPARSAAPASPGIIRSYIDVLGMRTFLLALVPWSLHITGVNILQGSLLYYFRYIYGDEGGFQVALPILLVSAIVCIPLWVRISRSIGKKTSYNIGMSIFAGSVLLFFILGHRLEVWFSYVIMAVGGTGFATQYVMPYAIVPDIVEYDDAENGVRREGVFYGLWTFSSKVGQAFGIWLSGMVLALFNYRESVGGVPAATQPDSALTAIRLLTGPIPALFFIAGVVVLTFYPITNEVYAQIMEKIRKRAEDQV